VLSAMSISPSLPMTETSVRARRGGSVLEHFQLPKSFDRIAHELKRMQDEIARLEQDRKVERLVLRLHFSGLSYPKIVDRLREQPETWMQRTEKQVRWIITEGR
jgi:hypothetical protein